MPKPIKLFEEVKRGDKGRNYHNEVVEIRDKGTLKQMFDKHRGLVTGASYKDFKDLDIEDDEPCVFVLDQEKDYIIYTYGGDGVWVEREMLVKPQLGKVYKTRYFMVFSFGDYEWRKPNQIPDIFINVHAGFDWDDPEVMRTCLSELFEEFCGETEYYTVYDRPYYLYYMEVEEGEFANVENIFMFQKPWDRLSAIQAMRYMSLIKPMRLNLKSK